MIIIQTTIHGFDGRRTYDIACSINSIINNKNQSTNIRELRVHMISKILLFHRYININIVIIVIIMAIINGISLEVFPKITKSLHIT